MRFFTRYLERSVTQANCNPLGYILALVAIVGGVSYHFRDAIFNVIKDAVMVCAAGFLVYAVIHIAGHIVAHRKRLAHSHEPADGKSEAEDAAADPVEEAERVVSQAYQGLGSEATQDRPGRVG